MAKGPPSVKELEREALKEIWLKRITSKSAPKPHLQPKLLALAAPAPVTKLVSNRDKANVTAAPDVTIAPAKRKGGRAKVHADAAARQRASRAARKKAGANDH